MFGEADSAVRSDTALCPVHISFSDVPPTPPPFSSPSIIRPLSVSQMNDGDGQPIIKNEDWNFIEQCMHKMVNSVERRPKPINETELRKLEGTIGDLRSQRPLLSIACQHFFYEKCKLFIEQYITSEVLPSFRGKSDESLLRQFVDKWEKHNRIAKMLNDVFYRPIRGRSMPPLDEVGLTLFHDMVYNELYAKVRKVVVYLIDQDREGMQIDRALLKKVLDIFVEIGMGKMDPYERHFEASLLYVTAAYYYSKIVNWLQECSCPDYMLKVEESLKREKERCSHYLHPSSVPKLLEEVQHQLLSCYSIPFFERKDSVCSALLREDKVVDLHRMFSLYSKIPGGLDPIANIFKKHVTAEGTALVKQAEDATSNKQDFEKKLSEFKLTCQAYVEFVFDNHALFDKAVKEAFEACGL